MLFEENLKTCPPLILAAVEATRLDAGLLWDGQLLRRAGSIIREAIGPGIQLGLAVKSFPHPDGLALLAPQADAFDLANLHEFELIRRHCRSDQEVWLTNCPRAEAAEIRSLHKNLWWNVANVDELRQAASERIKIAVRLDTTAALARDHVAFVESRFGWGIDQLRSLTVDECASINALHLHHSFEAKGDELLALIVDYALSVLRQFPTGNITKLNIGGGWGRVSAPLWRWARSRVPAEITLAIEPGRQWTEDAGWAFSTIEHIVAKGDGLHFLTGMLSPGAHLRWVFPTVFLMVKKQTPTQPVVGRVFWASRSCWEGDRLHLLDGSLEVAIGDRILFGGVAGYAVSWNHGFNGIPALAARVLK